MNPAIVWFRLDLRLADNPALNAALRHGGPLLPVFIYAPDEERPWAPGAASNWWLHQSLAALERQLREAGSHLVIRRGPTVEALQSLVKETGATTVFWNRRYEPAVIARDAKVKDSLRGCGIQAESFNGALLREPWSVRNKSERPFQVFTPFWKHCLAQDEPNDPLPAPKAIPAPDKWPKSMDLKALDLEPRINWTEGIRAVWQPGELGAVQNLSQFLTDSFTGYANQRDLPALRGTSRLSPHLHFGEITPRQIWHRVRDWAGRRGFTAAQWRQSQFLTELGWREFAHHLLFHFPRTPEQPLRPEFQKFPWGENGAALQAWQQGKTGFPMVDAGMRELWATGWMHNRVRMIVASFLVKDLLLSWQDGARWFWDTLVDADLANNTLGWQWSAGCGADAAPYFRIFNPTSQSEKFDPQGDYIRRWCPELAKLPAQWIHQPDAAPVAGLRAAGIELGKHYPKPLVDHATARRVALAAFDQIRNRPKNP